MKSTPAFPLFVLLIAAATAACGNHDATGPSNNHNSQISTAGTDTGKTNPGTPTPTTPTPPTPGPDSGGTTPSYNGPVVISGTVRSYVVTKPTIEGDTLSIVPASGASVTLVNPSSGTTVAHATADTYGMFTLSSVPAGTYKLIGQAAGSATTSFMLISAKQSTVTVALYVLAAP